MYQNDDAVIPALLKAGRTIEEARDYLITGCWGLNCARVEKYDGGTYVNMLKPFEYSIHNLFDQMEIVGMTFQPIENAKSFEEIYKITLDNISVLFNERLRITKSGGNILDQVDVFPIYSSTLENCLENRKDFTSRGAKYNDDQFMLFGLPDIVDSLLAIKELVFDSQKYTLKEFLTAVRANWQGYENVRIEAMRCHGWGDGSEESCSIAKRFSDDLYDLSKDLVGTYGGKVHIGYLTYTEVIWWGKKLLAIKKFLCCLMKDKRFRLQLRKKL